MQTEGRQTLLSVRDLKMHFPVKSRSFNVFSPRKTVKAVQGISFDILEGETLGLVGESGCGKSTTGKMIVKLLAPTGGSIEFGGRDIFTLNRQDDLKFRREVQIIFQDPYSSLDPHSKVGATIGEPLAVHKTGTREERKRRVLEIMGDVGLTPDMYGRYPHEFSGGQRQRIGVARALALSPRLIVCDEPVSSLDVSIQAQILNLMKQIQRKFRLTYLFISHNLLVVKHLCDRIAVMYLGHIVEIAATESLFKHRLHPYTQALFDSIPIANPEVQSMTRVIQGDIPSPVDPPPGCPFNTRCPYAQDICFKEMPPLLDDGGGHGVACHFYKEIQAGTIRAKA